MPTLTEVDANTTAKVAASRAEALRAHAATLTGEAHAPLRKALLIRAAELDLASDVLAWPDDAFAPTPPEPTERRRHLQAIAC